ncbi:MAG TPA: ThuA domain-containing protein [Armatimonadota bacterium]|nr:ThuA domain-containing protein [Armatimonadota bacterium]
MSSALIVQGGWEGHEPKQVAEILAGWLRENQFTVTVSDTLDSFKDEEQLRSQDLIIPIWTMGSITREQLNPLLAAGRSGVGLAGLHGGTGDAFRNETEYQYMVGGQWVAHPGGAEMTYTVNICDHNHPITAGVNDFQVTSEQYYMHVDPGNNVLATTTFANGVVMPAVWTRMYGEGRVFYCSVGHVAKDLSIPEMRTIMTRGMLWAARKQ